MTEPVTALVRFLERLPSIRAGSSAHFVQAKHTRQAESRDWDDFVVWCILHGCEPMPTMPEFIAASLASPWSSQAIVGCDARYGRLWQECAAASGGR